jgi:hypothetical protein
VRLQGKYVSVDPREWKSQYDVYINVGLGTGTREQQLTMLSMILQKQEALLGTPIGQALVGIEQYRSVLGRFIESAGFADSQSSSVKYLLSNSSRCSNRTLRRQTHRPRH